MVVVRVELWPQGDPHERYTFAAARIACIGQDQRGTRSYRVQVLKDARFLPEGALESDETLIDPPRASVWRELTVTGHRPGPRGVWDLLGGILRLLLGNRLDGYRRAA